MTTPREVRLTLALVAGLWGLILALSWIVKACS